MWIKMETERGHLRGSVGPLEGKGAECVMAILMFPFMVAPACVG
jgi:hypothetical protein